MPERAILELCDERPDNALVHEVDAVLQGLTTLRPLLVTTLLQHCHSIKAKRLFLALAERHHHAWLRHVKLLVEILPVLAGEKRFALKGGTATSSRVGRTRQTRREGAMHSHPAGILYYWIRRLDH
jgi:hypothetical protein